MSASFQSIRNDLKARKPAPVYFLHGEESFFSDRLVELFENYLPENERVFNLFSLYALEKEPDDVIDLAKRYPLMADKIIVLVKETQAARGGAGKWVNRLAKYAANPSPNSIVVVVARGVKVACKEFTDALKKGGGVILESPKLYDNELPRFVAQLLKDSGLNYEERAVGMLVENIGNDLSKHYNEIAKLKMILPPGATVTPESIEKNIGISREFNITELVNAIASRRSDRALSIIRHFNSQRDNPWVLSLAAIFSLFANALAAHYTDKSSDAIYNVIGYRNRNAFEQCRQCIANYSPAQIIEIIGLIRRTDAYCKGNGSRQAPELHLENLIMEIFMAQGRIR